MGEEPMGLGTMQLVESVEPESFISQEANGVQQDRESGTTFWAREVNTIVP